MTQGVAEDRLSNKTVTNLSETTEPHYQYSIAQALGFEEEKWSAYFHWRQHANIPNTGANR
jgi:hypothetical protein